MDPSTVLARLADPDPVLRGEAIDAWLELEPPRPTAELHPLAADTDPVVAFRAGAALAWRGDARGLAALLWGLSKPDLCFMALDALTELGAPEAREPLLQFFRRRFIHPLERLQAAAALQRLGAPEGAEHLARCLESRRPEERGFALELSGRLRLPGALERLQTTLADPRHPHRLDAARGLGLLGDARALPSLERAARDGADPELAEVAAQAVALLREPGP
ncbi:MAG TPA: HEAT repeat domain-containing protein [Myxococcota bacterium]|nr:HEAT repeat domain-containing protein [Myxococcota bacterium]HRY96350.1 HEAT repeat domain-containing protein [Myxococcota bacterium]HSA20797.1 HEAT repeat domain-containing protein [Myxococcota bacterium]